jgi:transposase
MESANLNTTLDRVIDEYYQQIERLEEKTERKVLESPAAQRLLTIPGVGQYTAAVIVAEVGEIERFDEDKQLASYAELDPVVHQSGDKEVRGSISKEGSAPLRWALIQCASIAVRCDKCLRNFYTRLKQRKNHQIAIVAAAQKMLISIFHMLTRKEAYDPPGVNA